MRLQRFSPFTNWSIFRWWRELALFLFFFFTLIFGGFASRLVQRPQDYLFFELFIKENMLVILVFCILWFIHFLKPKPERLGEFKLLNSLPFTNKQLAGHFLMQDFWRYAWAPALTNLLLFTLFAYSPIAHICRVALGIFFLYTILMLGNLILHLLPKSGLSHLLVQPHPIIVFLTISTFFIGSVLLVFFDSLLSGHRFWPVLSVTSLLTAFLVWLYFFLFKIWSSRNEAYRTLQKKSVFSLSSTVLLDRWQWSWPPMLYKNILRLVREKSLFVLLLTAAFILCGYLVARNNQRVDDFLSILFAAVLCYAIIFAYKSQSLFSEESDSIQIICSLPLRISEIHFSILFPSVAWLFMITLIFSLLALGARVTPATAIFFWVKSFAVSLGFLLVAFNTAFISYPDNKSAQKYFIYWGLILLVFIALFYKYRYIIFFVLVGITLIKVYGKKLYRVI